MENQPTVEIKEMPTKEVLEAFISSIVMGTAVTVRFNTETGMFDQDPQPAEMPRCGWA